MTASGTPRRPTSDKPEQLGFTKQNPVHWLSPTMLINTAGRVVLSDVFGAYLDKRELQSALPAQIHDERPGNADDTEVWFDFVADLGDGFDSTYSIAYLLAQDHLTVDGKDLPRGHFLLMGGDEVYPTPSAQRYEDKMKGPYTAAMPVLAADGSGPSLYALPGNHDWYDGLTSFMRLFVKDGKDHIGGWRNAQARSYFTLQLPNHWWVFAIDTQFGAYLDDPQLDYFHAAAAQLRDGDRVILATPSPSWVESGSDPGAYDTIDFFLRTVLKPVGAEVKVMLSGDLHHYARYANEDRQLIHCGGGGAYLYPTHRMPDSIKVPPPASLSRKPSEPTATYDLQHTFPSKSTSRGYASRVFTRVPRYNTGFVGLLGVLQTLLMCSLIGLFQHVGPAAQRWLELPIGLMALLIIVGAILFAQSPSGGSRTGPGNIVLGLLHGLAQVGLGVAGTWAWVKLPLVHATWPLPIVATLVYLAVVGLASTILFCAYLLLASMFGVNVNELFAGQSIIDSKSFLRLHIDTNGTLTVYVIAVPKVSRSWVATPHAPAASPWLEPRKPIEYELSEPPIVID